MYATLVRTATPLAIWLVAIVGSGCSGETPATPELILATTTSTRDSGLLDVLLPAFQERTGISVKVVAVGSGQALELGRRGDADVLLTHSPEAEVKFMNDGMGSVRRPVMSNDFVLVGPESDPAGVKKTKSVADAFRRIADHRSPFVSRGDNSGTHAKEQTLWKAADIVPKGEWHIEAGTGMSEALRMADQKRAYALSDRATYLSQRDHLSLQILSEGDSLLLNPYSVIIVSRDRHPHVRQAAAERFVEFLRGDTAREIIRRFGVERFGQPLFVPDESERSD